MNAPSLLPESADLDAFLEHLRSCGVRFSVDPALRRDPDQAAHPHREQLEKTVFAVPGLPPVEELRRGRIGSDHATWSVATELTQRRLVTPETTFWDIGTGTGLLALTAAALGAGRVVATDVCDDAVATAQANVAASDARVQLYTGSLLDAVPAHERAPDLMTANLPHKPRRADATLPLAEDGGPDGDSLITPFFGQARERLAPRGRVLFFQHSLPHPRNLVAVSQDFDLRLLSWKRRFLAHDEYPTLREWFVARSRAGDSYLAETGAGRFMVACVWIAALR